MNHRLAAQLAALSAGAILAGGVFFLRAPVARACGCFTPPDPTVPIVQAGERIAFQVEDGVVTAHIQIQYSGEADEFGWLLPLPSVPTLDVGTDELFGQLIQQTQPVYRLIAEYQGDCPFDPNQGGGDDAAAGDDGGDGDSAPGEDDGPLVVQDSIGPYDYAVLEADSEEPMLAWLDENGFFVPDGTAEAVDPYIRPGAFFLALKLRKGNDVGDIQPVVVKYDSDLPMIPIVLTGVAADPDMPVMVWVLGEDRAIPRNYFHTEINDAELNWLGFADNYVDVITRAVDEADEHQSFVTEYAGTTDIMIDLIDYEGRFGDLDDMRAITDAVNYVEYMTSTGWPAFVPGSFGLFFTAQTLAVLQGELPVPAALLDYLTEQGLSAGDYYNGIRYYVEQLQLEQPELFEDLDLEFDPQTLTDQLEERVVLPTQAAGKLFLDNGYMTRLFTTMSPDEMTRDPVFSFNPDLPDVSNVHEGRITYYCGIIENDTPTTTPATLTTENGFELPFPDGTGENPWTDANWPISQFIKVDREEGDSETVVDNTEAIRRVIRQRTPDDDGCAVGGGSGAGGALVLGGLGLLLGLRRRRR